MSKIIVLVGSMRKSGNTDLLAQAFAKADRLHNPLRNGFSIKKLGLLLVKAATLPNLFDAIKVQYQLVPDFFHLEDIGMVLVRGVKGKDVYRTYCNVRK